MHDNATLFDTEHSLVYSQAFTYSNLRFELQLNAEMTGYTLTVSTNDRIIDEIHNLDSAVTNYPNDRIAALYTAGEFN